jgi:hypothetical protein
MDLVACVFVEQFPRGVCTISSESPPYDLLPWISDKAHTSTLPLISLESLESLEPESARSAGASQLTHCSIESP